MTIFLAISALAVQDVPVDIARKDLPKLAECTVCLADGQPMGMEKPAAGVAYKGKNYFFCNKSEAPMFKKDPDYYLPPILPRPAPEFRLDGVDGAVWDARATQNRLVLIDYWATWCQPCKEMFPILEDLRRKYLPRGFEVLSVSTDEKRAVLDKFLKSKPLPNPVAHDSERNYAKWNVKSIPAMFLVRDGQIVAQWRGKQTKAFVEAKIVENLPKP